MDAALVAALSAKAEVSEYCVSGPLLQLFLLMDQSAGMEALQDIHEALTRWHGASRRKPPGMPAKSDPKDLRWLRPVALLAISHGLSHPETLAEVSLALSLTLTLTD